MTDKREDRREGKQLDGRVLRRLNAGQQTKENKYRKEKKEIQADRQEKRQPRRKEDKKK